MVYDILLPTKWCTIRSSRGYCPHSMTLARLEEIQLKQTGPLAAWHGYVWWMEKKSWNPMILTQFHQHQKSMFVCIVKCIPMLPDSLFPVYNGILCLYVAIVSNMIFLCPKSALKWPGRVISWVKQATSLFSLYGSFHKWAIPNSWIVYRHL